MSNSTGTGDDAVTVAFSVTKLTDAVTPPIAPSVFSTRAAHAAHDIPRIESSTSLNPGDEDAPTTAAGDIQPCLSGGQPG